VGEKQNSEESSSTRDSDSHSSVGQTESAHETEAQSMVGQDGSISEVLLHSSATETLVGQPLAHRTKVSQHTEETGIEALEEMMVERFRRWKSDPENKTPTPPKVMFYREGLITLSQATVEREIEAIGRAYRTSFGTHLTRISYVLVHKANSGCSVPQWQDSSLFGTLLHFHTTSSPSRTRPTRYKYYFLRPVSDALNSVSGLYSGFRRLRGKMLVSSSQARRKIYTDSTQTLNLNSECQQLKTDTETAVALPLYYADQLADHCQHRLFDETNIDVDNKT